MFIVSFMCIYSDTNFKNLFLFLTFRTVLESAIIQPSNVAEYSGKFVKMVYGVISLFSKMPQNFENNP